MPPFEGGDAGVRLAELVAPLTSAAAALGDSVAINGVCLTLSRDVTARVRRGPRDALAIVARPAGAGCLREPRAGAARRRRRWAATTCRVTSTASARFAALSPRATEPPLVRRPAELLRYVVEKGSIAVEGTSLTIAALDDAGFAVALVPHTLEATTLRLLQPGDAVNLEADVLAKYVER